MIQSFIQQLENKKSLQKNDMQKIMDEITLGKVHHGDLVHFLKALRDKGASVEEIEGAVLSLRNRVAVADILDEDLLDTCGTGGDGKGSFNISTAAAFVLAGAGVKIAKHGNRAVSSKSGSADVLRSLGVNVDASMEQVKGCIKDLGIGFLFAPLYYPAMKHVAQARAEIGTKTIFNILGPLLNPVGAKKQVIGVYDEKLMVPMAEVLRNLGSVRVALVHGSDGLDEITLTGKSTIVHLDKGKITSETFDPKSIGYDYCAESDLLGGSSEENALRLKRVLKGHSQPIDHCVHINAAIGLIVAGHAVSFVEAILKVQQSISSGRAYEKLEALIEYTNKG